MVLGETFLSLSVSGCLQNLKVGAFTQLVLGYSESRCSQQVVAYI